MSRIGFALVLAAALSGLSATAAAEELGGRFGLGADTSLGLSTNFALVRAGGDDGLFLRQDFRIPGLAATFYLTDFLGLQAIIGYQSDSGELFVSPDGSVDMQESSLTTVGAAVRVLLALVREQGAHLSIATGASFAWLERGFPNDADVQGYRLAAEIGIRPEWFVSENFSLHTQVGLAMTVYEFDPGIGTARSGFDIHVFGNANLLGNAGFTWWF